MNIILNPSGFTMEELFRIVFSKNLWLKFDVIMTEGSVEAVQYGCAVIIALKRLRLCAG